MRDLFVYYSASFGKGDGSEVMEYEVYPTAEQDEIFVDAVMRDLDLNDIPELQSLIDEAYKEIEEYEIDNLLDMEDEYTEECDEDGESPFDQGYDLYVRFPDACEFEPDAEDIEAYIKKCLEKGDWELALQIAGEWDFECDDEDQLGFDEEIENKLIEFIKQNPEKADAELEDFAERYDRLHSGFGELPEFAFRQAVIHGLYDYVEEHVYDVDLNNGWDGECTYLNDTDDKKMIEILMDAGAIGEYEEYEEHEFAVDSLDWRIIACSRHFQEAVLAEFMENKELDEAEFVDILKEKAVSGRDDKECGEIREAAAGIGVCVYDNRLELKDMVYEDGKIMMDVLKELGWEVEFDGVKNRFEQNGIYYVDDLNRSLEKFREMLQRLKSEKARKRMGLFED